MVGKLISVECPVLTEMWYIREFYSALKLAGTSFCYSKHKKLSIFIKNTSKLKEEVAFWMYLPQTNKGASWRSMTMFRWKLIRLQIPYEGCLLELFMFVSYSSSMPCLIASCSSILGFCLAISWARCCFSFSIKASWWAFSFCLGLVGPTIY